MNEQPLTLGERIVLAARLAVAKHLADAANLNYRAKLEDEDVPQRGGGRRQIVIGGAGPAWVREDRTKC